MEVFWPGLVDFAFRSDLLARMNQPVFGDFSPSRRALALFLMAAGLVWGSVGALAASRTETHKPNFILILADDLGYGDIGPFGSTRNRTPNLDRMAREGMKLTSFYAAPVCTPSRAQVLTGCYAKRVSLPNVLSPMSSVGLSAGEHTIAELLKREGYETMVVGKWHVGDHPDFLPLRHGFDHYFGLPYSNDMGKEDGQLGKGRRPPLPLVRDEQVIEVVAPKDQDRLTERYTDEAVKFIREQNDRPFFLYLPHTAVHTPIHPGDHFKGKSASPFSDWVEELAWSVGRVLDTVRELRLAERTLVIFTSDNGPWLPKGTNAGTAFPLRGGKGSTWEGGGAQPGDEMMAPCQQRAGNLAAGIVGVGHQVEGLAQAQVPEQAHQLVEQSAVMAVGEDQPFVNATGQRDSEDLAQRGDQQGDRLAGMSHDERRFGVARSGLMERLDGRHVPPLLGRFDPVGQEDQTAAAADELPGEESRNGPMRPEADQLGHVQTWGMEEGEQPVIAGRGEPMRPHETGHARIVGADAHGDQDHEEPQEGSLPGAGGTEGGHGVKPMNPEQHNGPQV